MTMGWRAAGTSLQPPIRSLSSSPPLPPLGHDGAVGAAPREVVGERLAHGMGVEAGLLEKLCIGRDRWGRGRCRCRTWAMPPSRLPRPAREEPSLPPPGRSPGTRATPPPESGDGDRSGWSDVRGHGCLNAAHAPSGRQSDRGGARPGRRSRRPLGGGAHDGVDRDAEVTGQRAGAARSIRQRSVRRRRSHGCGSCGAGEHRRRRVGCAAGRREDGSRRGRPPAPR